MMISRSARSILTRTSQRGLQSMQTKPSPLIFKEAALLHYSRNDIRASFFSSNDESSGGGFFSNLKNKLTPSSEKDAYKEQMSSMAQREKWTIGDFTDQIKEQMGWKTKIPGMGQAAAVKQLKDMKKLLDATSGVMGSGADASDLLLMDKKQKVRKGVFVNFVHLFCLFYN